MGAMADRRLKFWGWGYEDEGLDAGQQQRLAAGLAERFGRSVLRVDAPPEIGELELRAPRVSPPGPLRGLFSDDPLETDL